MIAIIYFTSDLHYGHNAILHMCDRPFESIDEMNKVLLYNYNSVVRKNDTVYILGDLAYRITVEEANNFIKRLNGKKILLRGNHDKTYDPSLFEEICDFKVIKYNGYKFSLMHYPLLEWPHYYHGGIDLHGHQHNTKEYNESMKAQGILRYDVGVDANDFKPVSIDEILKFFNKG